MKKANLQKLVFFCGLVMSSLSAIAIFGFGTTDLWVKICLVCFYCFLYWDIGRLYFLPWNIEKQFTNLYRLDNNKEAMRTAYFGIVRPLYFGAMIFIGTTWTIGTLTLEIGKYNLAISLSHSFLYGGMIFLHYLSYGNSQDDE